MSSDWDSMTYDEQRNALGLPEVRAYVARYQLAAAWRSAARAITAFGQAWQEAWKR